MLRAGWTRATAAAIALTVAKVCATTLLVVFPDYPPHRYPFLTTLAISAALAAAIVWLPPRRRVAAVIAIDAIVSVALVIDLMHVRFYGDLPSIGRVADVGNWALVAPSIRSLWRWRDVLFFLDLPILIWMVIRYEAPDQWIASRVRWRWSLAYVCLAAALAAPAAWTIWRDPDKVFAFVFERNEAAGALGVAGYHLFDAWIFFAYPFVGRLGTTSRDVDRLESALRRRGAPIVDSPLGAVAAGKNVILISAESLQAFALDLVVDGRPIAPHLKAFASESLSFTEFLDQTHVGTTADAEAMALTSLLPVDAGAVATRYAANHFRSLSHVLAEHGYGTLSAVAEPPSYWNMQEFHRALGFHTSLFRDAFTGEWVGAGVEDERFFDEMAIRLRQHRSPFFSYLLTSSNHHPFTLPPRLQTPVPAGLAGTMGGDYVQSVRYFDGAFGRFIDALRSADLLNQSIVVVYGDHEAPLEETDYLNLWRLQRRGRAPSPFDLWRFRKRVPLLVRLPFGAAAGERPVTAGHIDIAPTVLSLLGIDQGREPWLGRDLTAPGRRLALTRNGEVTDGQAYRLELPSRGPVCFEAQGAEISCQRLQAHVANASALMELSDDIVRRNLALPLLTRLQVRPISRVPPPRVLVIAHRGMSLAYPENTLPAIDAAIAAGADAVEVDIQLSRDGVPIVFHDDTLERTTNGRGLVSALSVAELRRLDAGVRFAPRFKGVRIPMLAEVLSISRGRAKLLLDLKMEKMAAVVASVYADANVDSQEALIGGWTETQRHDFRMHMPGARILRTEPTPAVQDDAFFAQAQRDGLWGFELGDEWPASFVGESVMRKVPVIAYTVNDEPTWRRLIEMGVSGIETDDPLRLIRLLNREPSLPRRLEQDHAGGH